MCELGLKRAQTQEHRANFYEWMAIAKAALGAPPRLVNKLFELAVESAPFNLRIRKNRDMYKAVSADDERNVSWEIASDTPAARGKEQLIERHSALAA
jgi:hypothetical protein